MLRGSVVRAMEYYSPIKKKGLLPFGTTQMDLQDVMLRFPLDHRGLTEPWPQLRRAGVILKPSLLMRKLSPGNLSHLPGSHSH